jgi:ATP-dependent phosphofructokinase / diphosphate-dependent phosphofructokinase
MDKANAFYAQSGGVTAVINASAYGVINQLQTKYKHKVDKIYAGNFGIIGALEDDLIEVSEELDLAKLAMTPGGYFGSCRYKLKGIEANRAEYTKLVEVFKKYNIKYFFYNGGGDSQDTAHKVSQISQELGYPVVCIGVPKTVDNDLPFTDNAPGFGSAAKYVAISTLEAGLDVASMCKSSTKVFILEVMGRHAGWIAAASGLAARKLGQAPHVILFPEVAFDQEKFLAKVKESVRNYGFCVVVASEGVQNSKGEFLAEQGSTDSFGHKQLGGLAPVLAGIVQDNLGFKYHWAVADYLQRAARHVASQVDVDQAIAVGAKAADLAMSGSNARMPIIVRESNNPYKWSIGSVELSKVANVEQKMPEDFITADGFGITDKCREYLLPLIQGEAYPEYKDGLPDYLITDKTNS